MKTIDFYIEFNLNATSIDEVFKNIYANYGHGKIISYTIKPVSKGNPCLKSITGKIEVIEVDRMTA